MVQHPFPGVFGIAESSHGESLIGALDWHARQGEVLTEIANNLDRVIVILVLALSTLQGPESYQTGPLDDIGYRRGCLSLAYPRNVAQKLTQNRLALAR